MTLPYGLSNERKQAVFDFLFIVRVAGEFLRQQGFFVRQADDDDRRIEGEYDQGFNQ